MRIYETGSVAIKICERLNCNYSEAIEIIKRNPVEESEECWNENGMSSTDVADAIISIDKEREAK